MDIGKKIYDSEGQAGAEVQGAQVQSVQAVRTAAGVHAEVWDVPDLFPRARPARRDPGHNQVELVALNGRRRRVALIGVLNSW